MPTKLDDEWIIERLELLTSEAEAIAEAGGDEVMNYRELTVLKLAVIAAGIDVYTKIVMDRFDNCHYIDALAGPGVTKLRESGEVVIGSPILAPLVAHEDFAKYHFIEDDSDRVTALRKRLQHIAGRESLEYPYHKTELYKEDCNEKVPELLEEIEEENPQRGLKGVNLFTVFDNASVNAHWETVEEVSNVFGDMIITFPPTRISRDTGRIEKLGEEWREDDLTRFFGTDRWKECETEDEFVELYMDRLERRSDCNRLTKEIKIESSHKGGRFYYYVIYATRATSGGSPYLDAFDYIKDRVEGLDGGDVEAVIDVFRGEQTGLPDFT